MSKENAVRMGELIDDLLSFSQLGRTEIKTTLTDMNRLVREVLAELQTGGIGVPADIHIEELTPVQADSNLMRQVWMNVISNAVKYSSKTDSPKIEIGMKQQADPPIYFIKDNGSGFDMKYYHKLFGVFQRLHNHDQFKGTGVGLALAQRIVTRHGGRMWADDKINEGATFYFSLPDSHLEVGHESTDHTVLNAL